MTQPDDDLRALFQAVREYDRARVPKFRAVWSRAAPRARTTARPRSPARFWIAAAACAVLAASLVLRRSHVREEARPAAGSVSRTAQPAPTSSGWRSPTAGLLRSPGHELLAPSPILSSVLDGATRVAPPRKGD